MRKLIVSNIMSLDGYYEGPDKNVMVLPMDEAFDAYILQQRAEMLTPCTALARRHNAEAPLTPDL